MKYILIIYKSNKITNNGLVSIFTIFWYLMKNNILRLIIEISRTKIYYYAFYKNFINNSILVIEVEKMRFLNLR